MTSTNQNQASPPIPPSLDHFVSQKQVVKKLKIAVEASFADGEPFPHLLLSSGPGLGKTTLAKVIGQELATEFVETTGQSITSVSMLNGLLLSPVNANFLLFIDEAHALPVEVQTALLKILEEGCMFLASDQRQSIQRIDLQPFSIILASTHSHLILSALRSRMKLKCQLRKYTIEDIRLVLAQKITQFGWEVEIEVIQAVAQRSYGNPRQSITLLESIRRTARSIGDTKLTPEHASETFRLEEIDEMGLGPDEQEYLSILQSSTKPVRLGVIASRMGQQALSVSQVTEQNLIALGFIDRTPQGRSLSAAGLEHVRGSRHLSAQIQEGESQ